VQGRRKSPERTRDALRHKRGNGERVGNIAFGYRLSPDQRHLEPDPTEQAALAETKNLRRRGHTLRGIAATLNTGGHRTRRGTEWRLESVNRIVKQNAFRSREAPDPPVAGGWPFVLAFPLRTPCATLRR
jgi:DNA invertase Pin-like site-specific DNA recombinase